MHLSFSSNIKAWDDGWDVHFSLSLQYIIQVGPETENNMQK